jgi:hypothetical protein
MFICTARSWKKIEEQGGGTAEKKEEPGELSPHMSRVITVHYV